MDEQPIGTETAASMIRRAAQQVEHEVQEEVKAIGEWENRVLKKIEEVVHIVGGMLREERVHPAGELLEKIEKIEAKKERLDREPEDAVWVEGERDVVEWEMGGVRSMKKTLDKREACWQLVLMQAAEHGVRIKNRQTLITEYLADDDLEDEDEVMVDVA